MKTLITALGASLALVLLPAPGAAQSNAGVAEGAKLYGQNCMRCHSARSPMERTDREWVTIVNHMRARANMRKSEARAVIAFLQATNVPEAGAPASVAAPAADADASSDGEASPPTPTAREGDEPTGAPPLLVLVDLADPAMDGETRTTLEAYLKRIRNP